MSTNDTWAMRISQWRRETPAVGAIEVANNLLDHIDVDVLRNEMIYYLQTLYNSEGPNMLQHKPVEGPEDFPILLHSAEVIKRHKARIRAIGLDAFSRKRTVDKLIDTIKKTLLLNPAMMEAKTVEQRDTIVRFVAKELYELQDRFEEIIHISKEVNQAYSDQYNFESLEYNIVNAMSYHRGLYAQAPQTGPTKQR